MDALAARLESRAGARRRLLRRARPLPGARRRGLRAARPCRAGRRRARPADRPGDADALGRRGGEGRPGGDPARPLRRLPARRADEQPRLRRPRPPRALPRLARRRASCSSPTIARSSTGRSRGSSRSRRRRRKVHEYAGTWSEYEAARERARAQHERDYADYVDEKGRYTALLRDRRTQAQQLGGPRKLARQTGGSDRRATNALRGKVQQAKNHLERLEEVEKPWSPWRLRLDLPAGTAGRRDRRARRRRRRARLLLARARSRSSCTGASGSRSSAETAPARRR